MKSYFNNKDKKIIIRMMAGLGNQMFQYAVGRGLSEKKNCPLWLDTYSFKHDRSFNRIYLLSKYNIKYDKVFNSDSFFLKKFFKPLYRLFKKISITTIKEPLIAEYSKEVFRERILTGKQVYKIQEKFDFNKTIELAGFWQSEEYFKNIKNHICKELTLKVTAVSEQKIHILDKIKQTSSSVCLGVRRYSDTTRHFKQDEHYYAEAIEFISKKINKPVFYVFSIEADWVRKNINFRNHEVVYIVPTEDPCEDLELIRACRNFIISNSSYYWWGAYLAENTKKIVVAPKQGWVIENPLPHNWIVL